MAVAALLQTPSAQGIRLCDTHGCAWRANKGAGSLHLDLNVFPGVNGSKVAVLFGLYVTGTNAWV